MGKNKKKKHKKEISLEERYKLMIYARNFHYENFNKWMTYFYVATGALFIGYCGLISNDVQSNNLNNLINYLIPLIGFIISILWYWSSKGYYFWNINFIKLVNHYEKDLLGLPETERVYFTFANKNSENNYWSPIRGANISTSKVAIFFAFIVTVFWGSLFFYNLIIYSFLSFLKFDNNVYSSIVAFSLSLLCVISFGFIPKYFLKSNIDSMPDLGIDFPKWKKRHNNK